MDGKNIELSRRRVLGGLATVGAASAAAGAGTFAYFSDSETSTNTVTTGTLDLTDDGEENGPFTIVDVSDAKPGYDADHSLTLRNNGTIDGVLSLTIDSVTEDGGDNPEPEIDAEGDESNDADLGAFLDVTIAFGSTQIGPNKVEDFTTGETTELGSLAGSSEEDVTITVSIPQNADEIDNYDNINVIQGDSVTVDATFVLDQDTS